MNCVTRLDDKCHYPHVRVRIAHTCLSENKKHIISACRIPNTYRTEIICSIFILICASFANLKLMGYSADASLPIESFVNLALITLISVLLFHSLFDKPRDYLEHLSFRHSGQFKQNGLIGCNDCALRCRSSDRYYPVIVPPGTNAVLYQYYVITQGN